MRHVLDAYGDRVLVGEIYLPIDKLVSYYGNALQGAQLPFNFQLLSAPWSAPDLARIIKDYEAALPLGAWPNWVLGNHDNCAGEPGIVTFLTWIDGNVRSTTLQAVGSNFAISAHAF